MAASARRTQAGPDSLTVDALNFGTRWVAPEVGTALGGAPWHGFRNPRKIWGKDGMNGNIMTPGPAYGEEKDV